MKSMPKQLEVLIEELNELCLPLMASTLESIFFSPEFHECDTLSVIDMVVSAEFEQKISKRVNARLRNSKLIGFPNDLSLCVDSEERTYSPPRVMESISTLKFIENGFNICILGPSDAGKSYLAKAIGIAACRYYKVFYCHCGMLLEELMDLKERKEASYRRRLSILYCVDLLIIDDFLLNNVTCEDELKLLFNIFEKRSEKRLSTIVCSQREPSSWKDMMYNDEVSANAIIKRATRNYTILVKPKAP